MDERLLARALTIHKKGLGRRTWRCPDEAKLAAYVDTLLDEPERQRLENHLADCTLCLDHVSFLVLTRSAETPIDIPEGLLGRAQDLADTRQRLQWAVAPRWALAAGVTASFALAAAIWLGQPEVVLAPPPLPAPPPVETVSPPLTGNEASPAPAPSPAVRNRVRPAILPNLLFPQEGSVIVPKELEFSWQGVERSVFYEIRLVTADGTLMWENQLAFGWLLGKSTSCGFGPTSQKARR
jgi:hypothetical protein